MNPTTRDNLVPSLRVNLGTPKKLSGISFSVRVTLAFAALLMVFVVLVVVLGRNVAQQHELEMQQRLSQGIARHIVEHWPQVVKPAQGAFDRQALEAVVLGVFGDGFQDGQVFDQTVVQVKGAFLPKRGGWE